MKKICFTVATGSLILLSCISTLIPIRSATQPSDSCDAPPIWFPNTPQPTYPEPDLTKDCDFYMPAWQTLLYVTENGQDGHPRFTSYETPDDLFGKTATLRLPRFNKTARNASLLKGDLLLTPRIALSARTFTPTEITQAGSNGILVDHNGHPIYYSVNFNDSYEKFIDQVHLKNNILNLPNVSKDAQFPAGAVELKSSWQVAMPGEDTSHFFTAQARLSKLKNDPVHGIVVDQAQPLSNEVTVKLVGFHIVFVMEGHPEFVWATFEHRDNAPDLPRQDNGDPGDPGSATPIPSVEISPPDPVTGQTPPHHGNWTFYTVGTPAKICNHKPGQAGVPPLHLDEVSQTLSPNNMSIFRQFPQGGEADKRPNTIDKLNDSVHKQVAGIPSLQVWQYYDLIGATWLNKPELFKEGHNFETDDVVDPNHQILGGDTELSNTTIETFTQNNVISVPGGSPPPGSRRVACFGCHTTAGSAIPDGNGGALPDLQILVSRSIVTAYTNAVQSRTH